MRDLGLLCRNEMLRSVGIMVVNGIRSVFLISVVPATFGPIWPWFRTAQQQFLHGPALGLGPVFANPCNTVYAGPDLAYERPWANTLLSSPLPLLRIGEDGKALTNLRKAENDDMSAFHLRSIKLSKFLLECSAIIAFVAVCHAKAFNDTELWKSFLAGNLHRPNNRKRQG